MSKIFLEVDLGNRNDILGIRKKIFWEIDLEIENVSVLKMDSSLYDIFQRVLLNSQTSK